MRKILLTSAGFENRSIEGIFHELIGKEPKDIKALFIPTAAIYPDAIKVLPKCLDDLLDAGVLPDNIEVYDLHYGMNYEELCKYDAIYVCGGDTEYLLKRINDTKFNISLKQFVDKGGVYVGVSAGSIVGANNLPNNLGFINCTLGVHVLEGSNAGETDTSLCPNIDLTNNQAILIKGDKYLIVE
ncbi:MAG: type 1 glutamine amidotransferase-like domain-containing protein [Clostridiales bacterium]|nr:type 1 glutamine amidotransferase-like domain-containing protein [Clostridiales bacterium]